MLEVDATHNNSVLKGFIYILKSEVLDSQEIRSKQKNENEDHEKGLYFVSIS